MPDGEVLTLKDYGNALIAGCALPPNAGGPCMKVAMVQDPVGRPMKIRGDTVITEMVISMTDKGYPIMVVSPGMSAISIDFAPVGSAPRQVGEHEVDRQKQVLALGLAQARTLGNAADSGAPFAGDCNDPKPKPTPKPTPKGPEEGEVVSAQWSTDLAKCEEIVKLLGETKGFGDGTKAKLEIFKLKEDGAEEPVTELSGTVQGNKVEVEWSVECGNTSSTSTGDLDSPLPAPQQPAEESKEDIVLAKWSTDTAKYEDVVKLLGETKGFGDGTAVTLKISKVTKVWRRKTS